MMNLNCTGCLPVRANKKILVHLEQIYDMIRKSKTQSVQWIHSKKDIKYIMIEEMLMHFRDAGYIAFVDISDFYSLHISWKHILPAAVDSPPTYREKELYPSNMIYAHELY